MPQPPKNWQKDIEWTVKTDPAGQMVFESESPIPLADAEEVNGAVLTSLNKVDRKTGIASARDGKDKTDAMVTVTIASMMSTDEFARLTGIPRENIRSA